MSRLDNKKRIFMVEKYHELKSSLLVIESWKQEYPNDNPLQRFCTTLKSFIKTLGSMNSLDHTKISKKMRFWTL